MASACRRTCPPRRVYSAFIAGAIHSAAACSKCVAASLSSAAERRPTSQAPAQCPVSTIARIWLAVCPFGAALTTLADNALSPLSFHHSGLGVSPFALSRSDSKADVVATAQSAEPAGKSSLASRKRCAASTWCPELASTPPSVRYASGLLGRRAMASR
eukprot:scaffold114601_cov72-Phaeocystis_antarctica.AAC.2